MHFVYFLELYHDAAPNKFLNIYICNHQIWLRLTYHHLSLLQVYGLCVTDSFDFVHLLSSHLATSHFVSLSCPRLAVTFLCLGLLMQTFSLTLASPTLVPWIQNNIKCINGNILSTDFREVLVPDNIRRTTFCAYNHKRKYVEVVAIVDSRKNLRALIKGASSTFDVWCSCSRVHIEIYVDVEKCLR